MCASRSRAHHFDSNIITQSMAARVHQLPIVAPPRTVGIAEWVQAANNWKSESFGYTVLVSNMSINVRFCNFGVIDIINDIASNFCSGSGSENGNPGLWSLLGHRAQVAPSATTLRLPDRPKQPLLHFTSMSAALRAWVQLVYPKLTGYSWENHGNYRHLAGQLDMKVTHYVWMSDIAKRFTVDSAAYPTCWMRSYSCLFFIQSIMPVGQHYHAMVKCLGMFNSNETPNRSMRICSWGRGIL